MGFQKKKRAPYNAYVAHARKQKFVAVKKQTSKWARQRKHAYAEAGVSCESLAISSTAGGGNSNYTGKGVTTSSNRCESIASQAEVAPAESFSDDEAQDDAYEANLAFPVVKQRSSEKFCSEDVLNTSSSDSRKKRRVGNSEKKTSLTGLMIEEPSSSKKSSLSEVGILYPGPGKIGCEKARKMIPAREGTTSSTTSPLLLTSTQESAGEDMIAVENRITSAGEKKRKSKFAKKASMIANSRYSKELKIVEEQKAKKVEKMKEEIVKKGEKEERLKNTAKRRQQTKRLLASRNFKGQPKMADRLEQILGKMNTSNKAKEGEDISLARAATKSSQRQEGGSEAVVDEMDTRGRGRLRVGNRRRNR